MHNFYRGMSKKGIKYNIWTIWTIAENFFFSPSRCWLVKIFIFCKKWKFWRVSILMVRKKISRGGSGGSKMSFNTILWYAAIKIWHRLIRFSHFWWFDFLHFLEAQKIVKIAFPKNAIFAICFFQFHQIRSFFIIFHVFCLQNPFLLSKF